MENVHRRKIRRRTRGNRQPPQRSLGVLLKNNEHLLHKILLCMMDEGLHECRRVCRHWRDACGKLPIKSCKSRGAGNLLRVVNLFPEAVSLRVESSFSGSDVVGRQAIQHLSRLKNLRDLGLAVLPVQPDIDSLTALRSTKESLRSFDVAVDQKGTLNDVVRVLRLLTNLEKLRLRVCCNIQTDLDPVNELRGLKHLCINLIAMVNSRGELLFPSLTRLTHLSVFLGVFEGPQIVSSEQV